MNKQDDTENQNQPNDLRDISKWTRIYAQNRSLPVVVNLGLFVLLYLAIAGSSYLAARTYRDGHMALFCICMAVLGPALIALFYFSVPRWGGKRMERMAKRLYEKEGNVAVSSEKTALRSRVSIPLIAGFMLCILISVLLGKHGYIPDKYMQPVSALYMVPFLVILTFLMRPAISLLALLWPALYAFHAILIVADVPILFTGRWMGMNMLIPTIGYGILTGLIGHAYNRYALHRLKTASQSGLDHTGAYGQ